MTLLNKDIKARLTTSLVAHYAAPRHDELSRRAEALAAAVLTEYLGMDDWDRFYSLPDDWLVHDSTLRWRVADEDARQRVLKTDTTRRLPRALVHGDAVIDNPNIDDALTVLLQDRSTLKAEIKSLDLKIRTAINSCRTNDQLEAAWPEAIAFLPKNERPVTRLPAVPVAELNAILGLGKQ